MSKERPTPEGTAEAFLDLLADKIASAMADRLAPMIADQREIVYSGQDGTNADWEIYTINAGGGGKFKVTDNARNDYEPSWGSS